MQINWIGYQYRQSDGYGRYSTRIIQALMRRGVRVTPLLPAHTSMPGWMQAQLGHVDWRHVTINCLPPFYMAPPPRCGPGASERGPYWLLSMTEGSDLPAGWAETIDICDVERVIVPCEQNAEAFRRGGVTAPIHVVPGGTDPDEFPLRQQTPGGPYTFLCLADRGARKGWTEVWQAFYRAFGAPQETPDVRLLVKCLPGGNDMVEAIAGADNPDPRIEFRFEETPDMAALYHEVHCAALPSRSEGWGMPHREAAMCGLPVIVQRVGGLDDDGYIDDWRYRGASKWALIIETGRMQPIPGAMKHVAGEWRIADTDELAARMRWCYEHPQAAALFGRNASAWLRQHQTWDHTAQQLMALLDDHGGDAWQR